MKLNKESTLNLVLLILLFIVVLIYFNKSRKNAEMVKSKIDTLSAEVQRMNNLTRAVADNLEHTITLIGTVSENLETSGSQLEELLQEAGSISSNQKQKIREALNDIRNSRKSVEEERQKALQLIGELNKGGNVPQ